MNGRNSSRLWSGILTWAALVAVVAPPTRAVVVARTTGNTSAPVDDFGFDHVGRRVSPNPPWDDATAVYVGYGWVLTAAHAGAGPVELNGVAYNVAGSQRDLVDDPNLPIAQQTLQDLILFKVRDANGLTPRMPPLTTSATRPPLHSAVTMVGRSWSREAPVYGWHVSGTAGTNWTWSSPYTPPLNDASEFRGFAMDYSGSSRQIRWGTNEIDAYPNDPVAVGDREIIAMRTDFDEFGGTPDEAQVFYGDSGGGVFYKRGDQWELAGIIHRLGASLLSGYEGSNAYPNQPVGTLMLTSTSSWQMYSYLSDLSAYRDQILDAITPILGDASLDGVVNDVDASILAAHWQMASGALWEDGDFNADGRVDDLDAGILAAHWHEGVAEGTAAVPEPAALVLLAVAAMMLVLRVTLSATRRRA